MDTLALCPFTVGTVIWQALPDAWTLTVCVKATFSLVHGRDAIVTDTQEPVGVNRHHDGDAAASLYASSDLVPYKPRTDVLLVGSAYAPGGRPVDALVARFAVGDLTRAVGIVGDRPWVEGPDGLEPGPPTPFTKMPLRYERAARGSDNPVGLDLAAPPLAGSLALPNLEAVDDDAGVEHTVGFGPIAARWRQRRSRLRGPGLIWVNERENGPPPRAFDFSYYNAAPPDQQLDLVRMGAKILLENLNPDHPRLESRLPHVRPKAFLIDAKEKATEIALRCDTVWIDTDRAIVSTTWRGLSDVETGDEGALGKLVIVAETRGREVRKKHIERMLAEGQSAFSWEELDDDPASELDVRHDAIKSSAPPRPASEAPSAGSPSSARAPSAAPRSPAKVSGWDAAAERARSRLRTDESTGTDMTTQRIERPSDAAADRIASEMSMDVTEVSAVSVDDSFPGGDPGSANPKGPPGNHGREPGSGGSPELRGERTDEPTRVIPELSLADYARIAVFIERGELEQALSQYDLEQAELEWLQSTWDERAATNPKVAHDLAEAIEAARWE